MKSYNDDLSSSNRSNLKNYKGEFYNKKHDRYQDPITGAHFKYEDVMSKLYSLQDEQFITTYCSTVANNDAYLKDEEPDQFETLNDYNMNQFLFSSQDNPIDSDTLRNKICKNENDILKQSMDSQQIMFGRYHKSF